MKSAKNITPWFLWDHVQHKFPCWGLTLVFISLTGITPIYISLYFLRNSWPPVISCDQLCCFPSPPMSSYWCIMVQTYYLSSQIPFWDIYLSFFYNYSFFYWPLFVLEAFHSCFLQFFYCFYYFFVPFLCLFNPLSQISIFYQHFYSFYPLWLDQYSIFVILLYPFLSIYPLTQSIGFTHAFPRNVFQSKVEA